MSGPEHYKEAERLLAEAYELGSEKAHDARVAASVHATLALAAATALPGDLHQEWLAATKPTRAGAW